MLKYACGEGGYDKIEKSTLEGALKITEYFQSTHYKAYTIVAEHSILSKYPEVKQQLYEKLNDEFKTSEAIAKGRQLGLLESTVKKFLRKNELFRRTRHGMYIKMV